MPRSNQTGEFNTFVGGLVTEASPLTFPENASIDEANFILNKDGSRDRRLGMDRETDLVPYNLTYATSPVGDVAVSAYEWKNVAGIASKAFIVCQVHDKMYIMDRADETLKSVSYVKQVYDLLPASSPSKATFAAIDGRLVVAYGNSTVKVVTYDDNAEVNPFSEEEVSLKIRDLFGVEDVVDGKDLLSPEYINFRPTSAASEDEHMYNLRNQGWGVPRLQWGIVIKDDPVNTFESGGRPLPSNADSPVLTIYPNAADATDANAERFNADALFRQEPARTKAATGHYVIDLLNRGASRKEQYEETTDPTTGIYASSSITFRTPKITLPTDKTTGGINVVSEFAGRVWYAGFSSEVEGGDNQSPNLASYVFYSQQVRHGSQIARCYQEGDPTDVEAPDILDTDGGFIRLSGAYNIQAMVTIGTGLMVLAENGVWFISGSDSGTFNANNQTVNKISEHGTLAPSSVVVVDSTIMYWSDDAIYHIAPSQVGGYQAKEISTNIRQYYQSIEDSQKVLAQGSYDRYEKRVRWVYDNTADTTETRELVFDIVLAAFFPSVIGNVGTSQVPVVPIQVSPFNVDTVDLPVVVGADLVLSDLDSVVAQTDQTTGGFRATSYLTLVNSEDSLATSLTFSKYQNTNFKDWESVDGTGVDAEARLLTGYIGTGDYQRFKQVPYIYFHFTRTETGFIDVGDDFTVLNESSCKVKSQWDWANSAASGKWGKEFEAYRYKRLFIPEDAASEYDNGHATVVSKNKLRGRGRVVSLLITSSPGKDMKLLGWSINIGVNGNV